MKNELQRGAKIDLRDEMGYTPLIHACRHGKLEMVKYLIEQGADVNREERGGETPLFVAAHGESFELLKLLISHGAKTNVHRKGDKEPIIKFAKNAYLEFLIANGADVDARDNDGHTALMDTIDIPRMEILIGHGAKINEVDNQGNTALIGHLAWIDKSGHFDCDGYYYIIDFLLSKEADLNIKNKYDNTVLHYAIIQDCPAIVKLLIEKGVEKRYVNNGLQTAASLGNSSILLFLLDHQAEINYQDEHGNTFLINAIKRGRVESIKILLERRADSRRKNKEKKTALDYARITHDQVILDLLTKKETQ